MKKLLFPLLIALTFGRLSAQSPPPHSAHVFFRVNAAASLSAPVSGRLLIFLKQGSGDNEVDTQELNPEGTWIAAREVQDLAPGKSIEVDAGQIAFPKPFSYLPLGNYETQAVLDVDHSYNYRGRTSRDLISAVLPLAHWNPADANEPVLTLKAPAGFVFSTAPKHSDSAKRVLPSEARKEEFASPLLSRFWGHPVSIRAWVILPPRYGEAPSERYPTVYWTHGFGGNLDYALSEGLKVRTRMLEGKMAPMIWVMLDESIAQGTQEFADSVNNGPWGAALTTEFLPYVERKYRLDARRNARFLNGHSSGGWATLQLEVNYPQIFGGTWSTSPDPSDFHSFTGADLYAPHANVYRRPDGSPAPLIRYEKTNVTFEQYARREAVLGPYGGQISSFDWVFSPKGENGAPIPMFDRQTGDVDPAVIAYWRDHFDLAHLVEAEWPARGRDLKGRIHLYVGTADTFYLDSSAHLFEAVLKRLDADPHFSYIPNRTHFDLYAVGSDRNGLFDQIAKEMYAVAYPSGRRR